MKSYMANPQSIKRRRYVVDVSGEILGRAAVRIATVLRGKHRPTFTPHVDTGDHVVVINASKVAVSGNKLSDKVYRRYSGYPSGLRERPLGEQMKRDATEVVRMAVRGMLPKGPLGRSMLRKLTVYEGSVPEQQMAAYTPLPAVQTKG